MKKKHFSLLMFFFFFAVSQVVCHTFESVNHTLHIYKDSLCEVCSLKKKPKKHVSLTSQWDHHDIRDVTHHFFDQVTVTLEMDGVWRMRESSVCPCAAVAFLRLLSVLQMDILILLPNTFSSTSPSFPSAFILSSFLFPFLLNFLSPSFLNTITFFSHSHPVSHRY